MNHVCDEVCSKVTKGLSGGIWEGSAGTAQEEHKVVRNRKTEERAQGNVKGRRCRMKCAG